MTSTTSADPRTSATERAAARAAPHQDGQGQGYPPAEAASDKYHGVPKFDVSTGKKLRAGAPPSYTGIFAETLVDLAATDRSVVAITAAMPGGTGIDKRKRPKRTTTWIAEQHAVTFAAGMAVEGLKPFCAIYSTFMQRLRPGQPLHLPNDSLMDRLMSSAPTTRSSTTWR